MNFLTHQEVIASLPLPKSSANEHSFGWQEIRACTFREPGTDKTSQHKLRVQIIVLDSESRSYGEVSTWASSAWKPIFQAALKDIPPISMGSDIGRNGVKAALDYLFEVGTKVCG